MTDVLKSTCGFCQIGCGIQIVREGKTLVRVEGDPDHPLNRGELCPKGKASLEYLYHPDRLKQPLKRVGPRGGGGWKSVSWEEALQTVADGLSRVRDRYGVESVAFVNGCFKGGYQGQYLSRFANVFGSPNILGAGYVCFLPRAKASRMTYGFFAVPDLEGSPQAVVIWGCNAAETLHHVHARAIRAVEQGARCMVIDPVRTRDAEKSDLWVQPRPGTDLALALGMLHVILREGMYDTEFVSQWTEGFEDLEAHVAPFTPEAVEDTTWVPASRIREAARFYAESRPACLVWGNAVDHGVNNFQTARALCILRAVTGNLGVPGGEARWMPPPVRGHLLGTDSAELTLPGRIPPDVRRRRIAPTEPMLPDVFYALPQEVVRSMRTGRPYPLRAAYVAGCNPVLTYPNAREVHRALLDLDFLVVADRFMTPTTALADVVLPVATHLEHDGIVAPPYSFQVALVQQQAARVGACRSDYEILHGLAKKLGLGEDFWETEEACLDFILEPAGISFEALRSLGVLHGKMEREIDSRRAFDTPSGKVELASRRLAEWGFDALPAFREPLQPDPGTGSPDPRYPLVLTTFKSGFYRHSEGRQIPSLRASHPEPVCRIHPQTAEGQGIRNGDPVVVETRHGRIRQEALLTPDVDPRVVVADYGWWFPEKNPKMVESWAASNVNVLIGNEPPYSREMGTPNLRGLACRIRKAQ